jgi:hypothetical protein
MTPQVSASDLVSSTCSQVPISTMYQSFYRVSAALIADYPHAAIASFSVALLLLSAAVLSKRNSFLETPIMAPISRNIIAFTGHPLVSSSSYDNVGRLINKVPSTLFESCVLESRHVPVTVDIKAAGKEIEWFVDNHVSFIQGENYDGLYFTGQDLSKQKRSRYFDEFRRDLFGECGRFPHTITLSGKENDKNIWLKASNPNEIVSQEDISKAWVLSKQDAIDLACGRIAGLIDTVHFERIKLTLNNVKSPSDFEQMINNLECVLPVSMTAESSADLKRIALESYNNLLLSFLVALTSGSQRSSGDQSTQCGHNLMSGAKQAFLDCLGNTFRGVDPTFEQWIKHEVASIKEDLAEAYYFFKYRNDPENRRLKQRYYSYLNQQNLGIRNKYGEAHGKFDETGFDGADIKNFIKSHGCLSNVAKLISQRMKYLLSISFDSNYSGPDKLKANKFFKLYKPYVDKYPAFFKSEGKPLLEVAFGADISGEVDDLSNKIKISPVLLLSLFDQMGLTEVPKRSDYDAPEKIVDSLKSGRLSLPVFIDNFSSLMWILPGYSWPQLIIDISPKSLIGEYDDFQKGVSALILDGKMNLADLNITPDSILFYKPVFSNLLMSDMCEESTVSFICDFSIRHKETNLGELFHYFTQVSGECNAKSFKYFSGVRMDYYMSSDEKCSSALSLLESYSRLPGRESKLCLAKELVSVLTSERPLLMSDRDKRSVKTAIQKCFDGSDLEVKDILKVGIFHEDGKYKKLMHNSVSLLLLYYFDLETTTVLNLNIADFIPSIEPLMVQSLNERLADDEKKYASDEVIKLLKVACKKDSVLEALVPMFLKFTFYKDAYNGLDFIALYFDSFSEFEKDNLVQKLFNSDLSIHRQKQPKDKVVEAAASILEGMSVSAISENDKRVDTLLSIIFKNQLNDNALSCIESLFSKVDPGVFRLVMRRHANVLYRSNCCKRVKVFFKTEGKFLDAAPPVVKALHSSNKYFLVNSQNISKIIQENSADISTGNRCNEDLKWYLLYLKYSESEKKYASIAQAINDQSIKF